MTKPLFCAPQGLDQPLNTKAPALLPQQQAALDLGYVHAVQQGFFLNSLTTGWNEDDASLYLRNVFGLNTEQDVMNMASWLINQGHVFYYLFAVVSSLQGQPLPAMTGVPQTVQDHERAQYTYYSTNVKNAQATLERLGFIQGVEDLIAADIEAWDIAQMVLVVRLGVDAGWLSEAKAWQYLNAAQSMARQSYTSWEDFARGLMIGCAMTNDNLEVIERFGGFVNTLLNDATSVWVRRPWGDVG